jgi:Zn-dependent peptidase ImmA (M78 family)
LTRPDDSSLSVEQFKTVRHHAETLLQRASAHGRFPTPVDDLIDAAKLTVVDNELLDEPLLRRFLRKTKANIATLKTALSKVLGLFEPNERLVLIDKETPAPRIPFIKMHEAGHGFLPHQSGLYLLIHDCEKTLDPDISDLFEREANVFASEVLFQGDGFADEARQSEFSLRVPMDLAKKYGASKYSAFRRYVSTSDRSCCLIAVELPIANTGGGFSSTVRRVVASVAFNAQFDSETLTVPITNAHSLAKVIPRGKQRICPPREIKFTDRNGDPQVCRAESFCNGHIVLILLCHVRPDAIAIYMPS